MTFQQAEQSLSAALHAIYDEREAANIADWVMEHLTGERKTARRLNRDRLLDRAAIEKLDEFTRLLLAHEPVQYVLQEAWFAGMQLYVNRDTLIPRPETEELVEWIVADCAEKQGARLQILDIGTGSGCIALALNKKIPGARVLGIDKSEAAIETAQRNTAEQNLSIRLRVMDFLDEAQWTELEQFHIIVSNPPYIPLAEKAGMRPNVLNYEPHLALFVPDGQALLFYEKIAAFAAGHLVEGGCVYVEINEEYGPAIMDLFREKGFSFIEIRKDMQGKQRMIKAVFHN